MGSKTNVNRCSTSFSGKGKGNQKLKEKVGAKVLLGWGSSRTRRVQAGRMRKRETVFGLRVAGGEKDNELWRDAKTANGTGHATKAKRSKGAERETRRKGRGGWRSGRGNNGDKGGGGKVTFFVERRGQWETLFH